MLQRNPNVRLGLLTAALLLTSMTQVAAVGVSVGEKFSLSKDFLPGDQFMGITLRGALKLRPQVVNGLAPRELSGLAWDADEGRLYALSDDGHLIHFEPDFLGDNLVGVAIVDAFQLQDATGEPLVQARTDAEGLVAQNNRNGQRGDTRLAISFEDYPRVEIYAPDGRYIEAQTIPRALQISENYAGKNKELEALTLHTTYGYITAPERPIKGTSAGWFTLYGLSGTSWRYRPIDAVHSALVGMESMQNGDLLLLERRFSSIFKPVIFALRRLKLPRDGDTEAEIVEEVVQFDTSKGWKVDNFEAVARHEQNRYFMISDDNENPIQKTLLLYFAINSEGGYTASASAQRSEGQLNKAPNSQVSSSRGINSTKLQGRVR